MTYNNGMQNYKGINLRLTMYYPERTSRMLAKLYRIGDGTQSLWIPNQYLEQDGTIKEGANLDRVFQQAFIAGTLSKADININPYDWCLTLPIFNTIKERWPKNHEFTRVWCAQPIPESGGIPGVHEAKYTDGVSVQLLCDEEGCSARLLNRNGDVVSVLGQRQDMRGVWCLDYDGRVYCTIPVYKS